MQTSIVIMTVGNELLIGKILDTNSHWLCKRITELGGKITRIITVPDDVDEISSEIRRILHVKPDMIITVGGLGPTFDDKTFQAVAKALSRRLILNRTAFKMLLNRYEHLKRKGLIKDFKPTKERLKMAKLPAGSKPIANPVGTAPAIIYWKGRTCIVSLPGVPKEMKAIFNRTIAKIIVEKSPLIFSERNLFVKKLPESELAPFVEEAMQSVPSVYIKSHPKKVGKAYFIELHLSTFAPTPDEASDSLRRTYEIITRKIKDAGGEISSTFN